MSGGQQHGASQHVHVSRSLGVLGPAPLSHQACMFPSIASGFVWLTLITIMSVHFNGCLACQPNVVVTSRQHCPISDAQHFGDLSCAGTNLHNCTNCCSSVGDVDVANEKR